MEDVAVAAAVVAASRAVSSERGLPIPAVPLKETFSSPDSKPTRTVTQMFSKNNSLPC